MPEANLSHETFLTVATNLLHRALLDIGRTEAKRCFRALEAGEELVLSDVRMEDDSVARFSLVLDHSEFKGRLNFTRFRDSLATLIANISVHLRDSGKTLPTFSAEHVNDQVIFGVTAVTVLEGVPNVLVLGAGAQRPDGVTLLQLLYLDPSQFEAAVEQSTHHATS
ncbi:MAG: hypothetical protein AAGA91_06340 [Pseudomonadota bacterium]